MRWSGLRVFDQIPSWISIVVVLNSEHVHTEM